MRVHGETHYLLSESIHSLIQYVQIHPVLGSLMLLALFGGVLEILRRLFGRIAGDMVLFALIITAILLLVGSSLYTFTHVQGFHFGG